MKGQLYQRVARFGQHAAVFVLGLLIMPLAVCLIIGAHELIAAAR